MKYKSITTTYHRSFNYGASLQAYALQQAMLDYGFDNQVLDFDYQYSFFPKFSKNIRIFLGRVVYFVCSLFHFRELKRQREGFDAFTDKLLMTSKYKSVQHLQENPPEAQFYITGSDQIFTLRADKFSVTRNMLLFGNENVSRYSFAASMADYDMSELEKKKFSEILRTYQGISLREKSAQKYLKTMIADKTYVHLDPVFLLSKDVWERIAKTPNFSHKYILYFQVNSNPIAQEVLNKLKYEKKLPVVCIQTNPYVRVKVDKVVLDASPEEFLGWILNASKVVTTSFHGTAFSILFGKDFLTITKKESNPKRISDLLEVFDMSDRMIDSIDKMESIRELNKKTIDEIISNNKKSVWAYFDQIKNEIDAMY